MFKIAITLCILVGAAYMQETQLMSEYAELPIEAQEADTTPSAL